MVKIFCFVLLFYLCSQNIAVTKEQQAEILVFSLSPKKVRKPKGILKIRVSTFSEIEEIKIKNNPLKIPKNRTVILFNYPYNLLSGENVFDVYVKTTVGETTETINIIYESQEYLKKSKLGDPFQLISIFGLTRSDNINKVSDDNTKTGTQANSYIFAPTYRFDLLNDSSVFLKGILLADQYQDKSFEAKQILFKQVGLEWNQRQSWIGPINFFMGVNEVGIRDIPDSNTPRDSLSKRYKRVSKDQIYKLQAKYKQDKDTNWSWYFERKNKSVEGSIDNSGFSHAIFGGYQTSMMAIKTSFGLTLEDVNLKSNLDDTQIIKNNIKVDVPLPPVKFVAGLNYSMMENKIENPKSDIRKKIQNQSLSLGLNYPLTTWCLIGVNQKHEIQSSNAADNQYKVNTTQFQVILIY